MPNSRIARTLPFDIPDIGAETGNGLDAAPGAAAPACPRTRREGGAVDPAASLWCIGRNFTGAAREFEALVESAYRKVHQLTPQSRDILQLLVDGGGNTDIAALTGLSRPGVGKARQQLLNELDARSTTDAIRIGICAACHLP